MLVLLALACSSVKFEGDTPFGPVLSAHWYVQDGAGFDYYTFSGGELSDLGQGWMFDELALRNDMWSCGAAQAFHRRWGTLSEKVLDADDDTARCEAAGRVASHLESRNETYHRMSASAEMYGEAIEPGVYDADAFMYYRKNDKGACGKWNSGTCSYEAVEEDCGSEDRVFDGEVELSVDAVDSHYVSGSMDGELRDRDTDDTARVDVRFTATVCPLPEVSALVDPY